MLNYCLTETSYIPVICGHPTTDSTAVVMKTSKLLLHCLVLSSIVCMGKEVGYCILEKNTRCMLHFFFFPLKALEIDSSNTKALYRRAQGWQGLKDYEQALVSIYIV